jgi:hypothetical protein
MASISAPGISSSTISASLPAQSVTTYVLSSSGSPGGGGVSATELVGVQSGKCLDVPDVSTTNGTSWRARPVLRARPRRGAASIAQSGTSERHQSRN